MKTRSGAHIRGFIKNIKSDFHLLIRALVHPKTSIGVKALIIGMILYILSPIDIIPDFILGLGLIDDLGVLLLVVSRVKKLIPQRLQDEILGNIIIKK